MIKCSAGTAKVIGLKDIKTAALPTTAYLMTGERCSNDCSFCPQAKNSTSRANLLSRVTWPEYPRQEVIARVAEAYQADSLKRACFQVVNSKDAMAETKQFLAELHSQSLVPVCVSCEAGTIDGVAELLNSGADHVSIALDAACERVFASNKGGSWAKKNALLQEASQAFPGRVATHLIVGLGETEEEMLKTIQSMLDLNVIVALFAFTPVKGTRLENEKQPDIGQYRRIQAARYLMLKKQVRFEEMKFAEDGRLVDLGLPKEAWMELLGDGEGFRTSGCSDCNRPYYNEKPGGVIYNYPMPLDVEQAKQALVELEL